MTDNDARKAGTEIQETRVRPASADAYRVDLVVADNPDTDAAEIAFSVSVVVKPTLDGKVVKKPALQFLQGMALVKLVEIAQAHIDTLNAQIR